MSVRLKLLLILLFVALVPLGVHVSTSLRTHREAFDAQLAKLHRRTAEYGARQSNARIDAVRRSLSGLATDSIRWSHLSEEERRGALWLVWGQTEDISVAQLLDAYGGNLAPKAYVDEKANEGRNPGMSSAALERFAASVPTERAKRAGEAMGKPFFTSGLSAPVLPLAFMVEGATEEPWVLAVGLSMRRVCQDLGDTAPRGVALRLVDGDGGQICPPPQDDTATAPAVLRAKAGAPPRTMRYVNDQDQETLAAIAPASPGWTVIAEQPAATAFASSTRMRRQSVFWLLVSAAAAVVAGLFLAQVVNRPIRQLAAGARHIAEGNLGHRILVGGRDEFGRLAATFNHMSLEIEKRNEEIREWNRELQARVDRRTRELKQAQAQLLQSRKMAAMASLGAGIAHEINNPLTGVLGMTQVLLARESEQGGARLLRSVESEALRIHTIVQRMMSLSHDYAKDGFKPIRVSEVLDQTVRSIQERLDGQNIEVDRVYDDHAAPVLGSEEQLRQAFLQLIDNSIKAMPHGGRLRLEAVLLEGELIKAVVHDTGKGIEPGILDKIFEPFFTTKDNWRGEGLGLAVAYRIFEAHNATVAAVSEVGKGTTITVNIPTARVGSHLA